METAETFKRYFLVISPDAIRRFISSPILEIKSLRLREIIKHP